MTNIHDEDDKKVEVTKDRTNVKQDADGVREGLRVRSQRKRTPTSDHTKESSLDSRVKRIKMSTQGRQ